MPNILAIIPAKRHSEGVPDKNWTPIINGLSCYDIALNMGAATCQRVAVSTDAVVGGGVLRSTAGLRVIARPGLTDAMVDVVRHALSVVPGDDMEIVVLLQPTSPLRTVATVKRAIDMLETCECSSVVSVSPCYPPEWALRLTEAGYLPRDMDKLATRRQDLAPAYKRDGVVYATRRWVIDRDGLYGPAPRPLFTPPEESLSIDTPEDWEEAVRRLKARQASDAALSTGKP